MGIFLITAAVLPAVALLVFIYRQDKLEREPGSLLIKLLIGGFLATACAIATETIGENALSLFGAGESDIVGGILEYFLVVALSEEGFKYFFLKRRSWNSPAFNCQFDGIVYAVFISLGFALLENLGYVGMMGLSVAYLRAGTAIPGHACFGAIMGLNYGKAKKAYILGQQKEYKKYKRRALLYPVLWHGAYDFLATRGSNLAFIAFLALLLCMYTYTFKMVKKASKEDSYFITPEDNLDFFLFNNNK